MVAIGGLGFRPGWVMRRLLPVVLVSIGAAMGASAASAAPLFTRVTGSPFNTTTPRSVGFSPDGKLLAAVNGVQGDATGSAVSVFTVDHATHRLTPVAGSPFAVGYDPRQLAVSPAGGLLAVTTSQGVEDYSVNPTTHALTLVTAVEDNEDAQGVAFSPDGSLLAVANLGSNSVSLFSVDLQTGALTEVNGSPFADLRGQPNAVAFSSNGGLLALANSNSNTVAAYSVDPTTHALAEVKGSPFPAGRLPLSLAFSPTANLLANINGDAATLNLYRVNSSTHQLAQVAGSPFGLKGSPNSVAFSPNGALIAVPEQAERGQVEMLSVNPTTGAVHEAAGSPYHVGGGPESVAFSPSGGLFATANNYAETIALFATPACQNVQTRANYGQKARVRFSCADAAGAKLHYSVVASPSHGSVGRIDQTDGQLTYTPHRGFSGTDTFTYRATSSNGTSPTYTVQLKVLPNNTFKVSHIKAKSDGVLTFDVRVPGPGALKAVETAHGGSVAHGDQTAGRVSTLTMTLTPGRYERSQLSKHPTSLQLAVTFTPKGGLAHPERFSGIST